MASRVKADTLEMENRCVFEGMEGFDGVSLSDDSSLIALLDDLKEETLVSLLDDNLFAKDLSDFSWDSRCRSQTEGQCSRVYSCTDEFLCSRQQPLSVVDPKEYLVSCEDSRDGMDDAADYGIKKARLDISTNETSDGFEIQHALTCVLHDHSYATEANHQQISSSNSNSDEEASNEEGSNSDTGYDTMSSSTSPGRGESKEESSKSESSPISRLPLESVVDPVALIDARIKHYMCTREVNLTEEEKETLKAEGLPIPTTLPLTRVEEKALKNVRRKIRNKMAAQESRKRKKEFVQTLENRVSIYDHDNAQLKSRVKTLENENKCLLEEVKKLRSMVAKACQRSNSSKVGTYIMVIILCFAVYYGGQSPFSMWGNHKHSEYATSSVRSRSLLSTDSGTSWHFQVSNWIRWIFMTEYTSDLLQSLHHSPGFNSTFTFNDYNHARC